MNGDTLLAQLLSHALQQRDQATETVKTLRAELEQCRARVAELEPTEATP